MSESGAHQGTEDPRPQPTGNKFEQMLLEAAPKFVDHAAKKSDRWWFFALLIVGILWTGWNQWKQESLLAERDSKMTRMEEKMTTMLQSVIAENSKAFQANTEALRRVELELTRLQTTR